MTVHEEPVIVTAADGFQLSASAFWPDRPKASVLLSSGTGFPKEFYARLAQAGAERGYAVLTYDYRGIAGSVPETGLRGFEADMLDWGRLDMTAAGEFAMAMAPGQPLFTLGHSVGGHLIGFSPIGKLAAGHAFINVGSGYWGKSAWHYMPLALFFWMIYGPACLAVKGYIPGGGLWGGTALPRKAFMLWRSWCLKPGYFGDVLNQLGPQHFAEIDGPIHSWGANDDPIANRRTTPDILRLYSSASREATWLEPKEFGLKTIGHQGLMSRRCAGIWPQIYDWFDMLIERSATRAP
ncbi:serine aminopeptidase domain-containing protein [Hyphobacterium sp.]|uniref:alpha/beta hydrolase family protein n=1 Tax=Hyphobacterium sp. TaxID=2004662 RepID=UPI003B527557